MAEYIEKQAARPDEFCVGVSCQECPFLKDHLYGGCRVDDFIMALPPADVRPVVRGKWEVVDWVEYDGHGECVHYPKEGLCCTNCKNAFKKKLLWKDNYCPNCGADMRGGDSE